MSGSACDSKLSGMTSSNDVISEKIKKKSDKNDIQALAEKFIADHSERSFNALMKRCMWGLRSLIFSMTNNDYDTDNILSITMEHIYYRIGSFNGDIGKFSTWIYRIAHNDTIDYHRRLNVKQNSSHVNIDISEIHEHIDCDDDCEYENDFLNEELENMSFDGKTYRTYTKGKIISDMYDASAKCVDYLPDHLRIVMTERYMNNKTVKDIAKDNNIPVSSVKNWIRKGKLELENEVRNRYEELLEIYKELKIV